VQEQPHPGNDHNCRRHHHDINVDHVDNIHHIHHINDAASNDND